MSFTTSIGSLPYENVEEACEYVFKYDLPFYPELAKARSSETLIGRIEKFYQTADHSQVCDEEFKSKIIQNKVEAIKWQVVCPLTFYKYQSLNLNKDEVYSLLKDYIRLRLSEIRSYFKGTIYLCLDAPGITFELGELSYLSDFLFEFKSDSVLTGIHLCQKLGNPPRPKHVLFDFISYDALLNDHLLPQTIQTLAQNLIYGIYDFREDKKAKNKPPLGPKDGISSVCGLNGATSLALFSCLNYLNQVK